MYAWGTYAMTQTRYTPDVALMEAVDVLSTTRTTYHTRLFFYTLTLEKKSDDQTRHGRYKWKHCATVQQ